MFPLAANELSFADISDVWSREIKPKAYPFELLARLEGAWWRGEIRGLAASTRLQLLQSMFSSLRERHDLGIVFVREEDDPLPRVTELPRAFAEVDIRPRIPIPSDDVSSWNEEMCKQAFDVLAQTSSTASYPDLAPFFALIKLPYEEFDSWRKAQRFPKPSFWAGPAASGRLQKRNRGRPLVYNWEQVHTRLLEHVKTHGPIRSDQELVQSITDHASDLNPDGKTPDGSTVRDAIEKYGLDKPPITPSAK